MKQFILIAVACLAIVVLALAVSTSGVNACGGWHCGDAGIILNGPGAVCVNNQLLTVNVSTTTAAVIQAPAGSLVSSDIPGCGGNTLVTKEIPADAVQLDGSLHSLTVHAKTDPNATVELVYGNLDVVLDSGQSGVVNYKFDTN
ncbi:MAG: hypothetical protein WCF84_10700 [Anaerolineae bacterium]